MAFLFDEGWEAEGSFSSQTLAVDTSLLPISRGVRLQAQDACDSTEELRLKEEVSRLKDLPAQAESRREKTLKLQEDPSNSKQRELEKKDTEFGQEQDFTTTNFTPLKLFVKVTMNDLTLTSGDAYNSGYLNGHKHNSTCAS
ncbi:unnamed protein product [Prunus armeniaca]|uniref:Uncharacterized protein n=1 Tax=Prunus armeniaca TaxID=36596 RepID=A0A6J5TZD8_PRUAR|nr:unnamed protein product [Prunus armeniaca]